MLQIYVYGPTQQGFLEMPPETVLNMEALDELFDEDFSFGEFSLPVEIPWTPFNRKLLGFLERLQNFALKDSWFRCDVYDSGFPELVNAKLSFLERSGQLDYQRGSFSASISGNKGLYGSKIKNVKLTDLAYGGVISWSPAKDSRTFATDHMQGATPQYPWLGFAPVAIEKFVDTERKDYAGEFLAKDTVNYVFKTGSGANDWKFANESPVNPGNPTLPTETDYLSFYTIPFLQLKYVIQQCFVEMGFTVSGNWFTSPVFDPLFLFNNYAIEKYVADLAIDVNYSINPANHVPELLISDFLREVCKSLNLMISFPGDDHCVVEWRKDKFTDRRTMNITPFVATKFGAVPIDQENQKGYTIEYQFDSADGYPGDMVRSLEGKTLVATVFKKSDLSSIPTGGLDTDSIALVSAENLYYVVADATVIPVEWEVFGENLDKQKYGNGEKSVSLTMAPLCQYAEIDSFSELKTRRNYVGCRLQGSYQTHAKTRVKNSFGLRVFYIDMLDLGDGVVVPVSSNHDTDADGIQRHPYSLAFNTDRGIDKAFHRDWQKFLSKGEVVKINMRMDKKIANDMRNAGRYDIGGVLFYKMKTERSIPMQTGVNLELVTL